MDFKLFLRHHEDFVIEPKPLAISYHLGIKKNPHAFSLRKYKNSKKCNNY